MIRSRQFIMMTSAAALCAAPMLAFGQTSGGSQAPGTTQQPPAATAPATPAPGTSAQGNPRDGTPGNPPSTAVGRAVDSVTGQRTDPDGTGNNPPGTAAGRAMERAGDAANNGRTGTTPNTTTGSATPGATGSAATGATGGFTAVDSARVTGGRRASRVIGSNVYNEANESIGEVDDIIIPQGSSQPVAILSVGGFLGIGSRLVAVPYERLQHASDRDRWMLQGATKDSLRTLPEFRYDGDTVQRRG